PSLTSTTTLNTSASVNNSIPANISITKGNGPIRPNSSHFYSSNFTCPEGSIFDLYLGRCVQIGSQTKKQISSTYTNPIFADNLSQIQIQRRNNSSFLSSEYKETKKKNLRN